MIGNNWIQGELSIESVEKFIEQRRFGWWVNLQSVNNPDLVKRLWGWGRRREND